MSNGKGSTPRPFSVDIKTYKNNWDNIFGSKEKDVCEYSGLPSTSSYEDTDEYLSSIERLKQQEEIKQYILDLEN